ncbi:MAG: hypothetical protein WB762_24455 [Candidatus Sulfotelmatobacter sp.]
MPLYLQKPAENYWFTYLPKVEVLYLQYKRAQANSNGASPIQFEEAVEQAIDQHHPRAILFDLRFNTGGDGFMAEPLIKMIASKTSRLKVFEIIGRSTFSAGVMVAAELREWANATVAGEPAGDGLHFWAEGGNLVLPNSGLAAHYANGFHDYSTRSYSGTQPFVRLTVDTLSPALPLLALMESVSAWRGCVHGFHPEKATCIALGIETRLQAQNVLRIPTTTFQGRDRSGVPHILPNVAKSALWRNSRMRQFFPLVPGRPARDVSCFQHMLRQRQC